MRLASTFLLCLGIPATSLAQNTSYGKLTSGLSMALIVMIALLIFILVKYQKVQQENKMLKEQLNKSNKE